MHVTTILVVTPVHKESIYWWSDRIAELRKYCNQARRRWQKEKKKGHINNILKKEEEYRISKKNLCTEIKKAKAKAWDELIQSIEKDPWGLPYRIVLKKLRRSSPSFSETLPLEVLEQIVNKLFPQDPHWNDDTPEDDIDELWLDEYNISVEEVNNILKKKAGTNKAPGIDGIKSIFLKRIPPEFLRELVQVYNECLQKSVFPKIWKRCLLILIPKGNLISLRSKLAPYACSASWAKCWSEW